MSQFLLKDSVKREALDWGILGWTNHPPVTGTKQLTVLDVEITPGDGHAFHKHPEQEEVIFVVSGQVEQWIEQEKQILTAGDAVYIDADVVHASFNVGDENAKLLAILSPCVGDSGYAIEVVAEDAPWNSLR
jgi:quercetin dioxygenase-like cupin family protein